VLSKFVSFVHKFRFVIDREDWFLVYCILLDYSQYYGGVSRGHQFLLMDGPGFEYCLFEYLCSCFCLIISFLR
jgi:hypothetical protein